MLRVLVRAGLLVAAGCAVACNQVECNRISPRGAAVHNRVESGVKSSGDSSLAAKVLATVAESRRAVVRIFFGESDMITGTLISADGIILTCAHLPTAIGETVTVVLSDDRAIPARVLSKLPKQGEARTGRDIALLQVLEGGPFPFAPVAEAAPSNPEEPLLALGYPDTLLFGDNRRTDPLYVRLGTQIQNPYQSDPGELCTTIRGTGGDSGGPLFDLAGRVVGVVHGGDLSGAHVTYTRIEILRRHWDRLAPGRNAPAIPPSADVAPKGSMIRAEAPDPLRSSVVEVHSRSRLVAMGTVVGDGLILTKASELGPSLTVVTANDFVGIAEVAALDPDTDLALLKLAYAPELTRGIEPVRWVASENVPAGTVVTLVASSTLWPQVGVTCFEAREVPVIRGQIPCEFEQGDGGVRVVRVIDELRTFRLRPVPMPLRPGDTLLTIEGVAVRDTQTYREMMFDAPKLGVHPTVAGEPIRITFRRGERTMEDVVGLEFSQTPSGQLVRPVSARYSGFSRVIATDLPARPEHGGAPAIDARGRLVGMLIARAPFVEALLLPSDEVERSLARMLKEIEQPRPQESRER